MPFPLWSKRKELSKYENDPNDHSENKGKLDLNNVPEAARKAVEEANKKHGDVTANNNSTGAAYTNKQ